MRHILIALVAALGVPWTSSVRAASDADAACRAAMAPYYAALLASARGDPDGTLRQVFLLKARWDDVTRRSESDLPPWLRDTAGASTVATAVAARIDATRHQLPRNITGAHADLEAIRVLLRDARTRHGVRTLDDAVTDYHEAMERVSSHIGLANEIVLTAADFKTIAGDAARARSAWTDVESHPELAKAPAGWKEAALATTSALASIARAADRRDGAAAQQASQTLRRRYSDLLSVLSHRQ